MNATHRLCAVAVVTLFASIVPGLSAPVPRPVQPDGLFGPAPKLSSKVEDWLNTDGKKLEFERGRVYVVQFWTFGCINCLRNLPAYGRWQERYAAHRLTIIGVHTPETKAEKQTENVYAQVKKLGITYPVLLDQAAVNWNAWQQQVWPTIYLVDKRGKLRYRWVGELEWQNAGGEAKMSKCIEKLLAEP
jgi:thiol-disulfide isomerase/thioredoxin